jgi:VIT1/CCC1 family predicted Fe2+/Mn2+ transporter
MNSDTPPPWAEELLRLLVKPAEFDNVSGDLLEEYRVGVLPARGRARADIWYVRQVLGFVSRNARLWAALLGAAFISRTAFDWLVPTVDVHTRSIVSTYLAIGILLIAGFAAARRSGSVVAGTVLGLATMAIGAAVSVCGAGVLLIMWHDAATMAAIDQSGGLAEVFTLPVTMLVPGAALGTIGGVAGSISRRLWLV